MCFTGKGKNSPKCDTVWELATGQLSALSKKKGDLRHLLKGDQEETKVKEQVSG